MTMTKLEERVAGASDVRHAVEALLPTIARRAGEIEQVRQLPPDLFEALRATGCFALQLPPSHGGSGAPLPDVLSLVEAVSRADASTGWTVAIGAGSWIDLIELPRETFDSVIGDARGIVAGAFRPSGTATLVDDGYEVSGRWAFASNCVYADRLFGNTFEPSAGPPGLRTVVFERDQVEIEDTWRVLGMRGTASHHFRADHVIVPVERTCVPLSGHACVETPYGHIPPPSMFALEIVTVALGAARGAIDDVLDVADRVPMLEQEALSTNRHFQHRLAEADTALRAARSLVWECAGELWELAEGGSSPSIELVARTRAAAAWSAGTAVDTVTTAYRLAGGSALYDESPLQRRLRDVNTIAQHFLVKPDTLTTAGRVLSGQEPGIPIF